MQLKEGDSAPLFTLFSTEKKEISLGDYRGKNVVLLFFPLAFTDVCTAELCHMRDHKSNYDSINAEIIAVSVDSLFSLEKFKAEQSFNFTVLSDFNKEVSRSYGSLYEDFVLGMKGVSKRSAFVINKEGQISHAEVLENVQELPNFDKINEVLDSLK